MERAGIILQRAADSPVAARLVVSAALLAIVWFVLVPHELDALAGSVIGAVTMHWLPATSPGPRANGATSTAVLDKPGG